MSIDLTADQLTAAPPHGPGLERMALDRERSPLCFSRQAMRRVDREAMERFGIPGILLMERAALGLAREALAARGMAPTQREPTIGAHPAPALPAKPRQASAALQAPCITCLCGPGNNGGDGWCAARILHCAGVAVEVIPVEVAGAGPPPADGGAEGEAQSARRMARAVGIRELALHEWDPTRSALIIDALLGTGADRPAVGAILEAILAIRGARRGGAMVISADIPSGLDADSGAPLGSTVEADLTVTFAGIKRGLLQPSAAPFVGRLIVVPIGVPRALLEAHAHRGEGVPDAQPA